MPGTPTALDQDPLTVLQHQRCEDPKPGPALMGAIAQKEGVLVLPLTFECHRMKLNLPAAGIGGKVAQGPGWLFELVCNRIGKLSFFMRPVHLPDAQSGRDQAHHHTAQQQEPGKGSTRSWSSLGIRGFHTIIQFMKWLVSIFFLAIVGSLAGALFFMMRRTDSDGAKGSRMAKALALRIGLSVGLFLFMLFAYLMGWIEPTGIRSGQ